MIACSRSREHLEVRASEGEHVGTVGHLEGADRIKLTRSDPSAGCKHHFTPVEWVERVDTPVHLSMLSHDVPTRWQVEA